MQLCFFEDALCSRFNPLTLTRPTDDLRTGITTLREKWLQVFSDATFTRLLRDELKQLFPPSRLDPSLSVLWINSRYLPVDSLIERIKGLNTGTCLMSGKTVIAARVDGTLSQQWLDEGTPHFNTMLVIESADSRCITQLWDLFLLNSDEIKADIKRIPTTRSSDHLISPSAHLSSQENVYIGKGATIEAGSIIIADDGPVYIGPYAKVMAGATIRGPVAICEKATINMGAKIYPGTTIGPVCKAGGEIHNSILHSYSNKGHHGFLGHSLLGQWCNLGAGTTTSNLKNNYGTVHISDWESGHEIETGQQFIGTIMGDHTKTAINTQLNTGTLCGVSCNIFSDDFPPKHMRSFSWVGSNVIQSYKLDKALETMKAMMARRDVELTKEYETLMQSIFDQSKRKTL